VYALKNGPQVTCLNRPYPDWALANQPIP